MAAAPPHEARDLDPLEVPAQAGDPVADLAAVELELLLARSAPADAAAQAREVACTSPRAAAGGTAAARARPASAPRASGRAARRRRGSAPAGPRRARRRPRRSRGCGPARPRARRRTRRAAPPRPSPRRRSASTAALADVRGRIRGHALLQESRDDLSAGGLDQALELVEVVLGDRPRHALRRNADDDGPLGRGPGHGLDSRWVGVVGSPAPASRAAYASASRGDRRGGRLVERVERRRQPLQSAIAGDEVEMERGPVRQQERFVAPARRRS